MGLMILYLDTILVPSSLFITIGYHAYLFHSLRHKPCLTTIGINSIKRRCWLQQLNQGDDKKGMLAVQSLRNTLMATILTALVTIFISLCLAALINNTFNFKPAILFTNTSGTGTGLLGPQSSQSKIIALKYGSTSIFLMTSFLSSSMGLAFLIDANFLINAVGDFSECECYTQTIMERGFTLAMVGNRVLCITFPLMLWMFGPVPVLVSSLVLVGALRQLDFPAGGCIHFVHSNQ